MFMSFMKLFTEKICTVSLQLMHHVFAGSIDLGLLICLVDTDYPTFREFSNFKQNIGNIWFAYESFKLTSIVITPMWPYSNF